MNNDLPARVRAARGVDEGRALRLVPANSNAGRCVPVQIAAGGPPSSWRGVASRRGPDRRATALWCGFWCGWLVALATILVAAWLQ